METSALPNLLSHSFIFIDANIFVYGLSGQSGQCRQFLDRRLKGEVTGITLFETVNEVTRRLMVAEDLSRGLITRATASGCLGLIRRVPSRYPVVRRENRLTSSASGNYVLL